MRFHLSLARPSFVLFMPSRLSRPLWSVTLLLLGLFATSPTWALVSAPANVVTTTADDGSAGSLRSQIASTPAGGTITFDPKVFAPGSLHVIKLTSALPIISQSLTVTGPGAGVAAVDGGGFVRCFIINDGTVTISGLTIQNGFSGPNDVGGGIYNGDSYFGGGGSLTLTNCTLTANRATGIDGISTDGGGAISNGGSLTMTNCILTANSVTGSANSTYNGGGGAISNGGSLTMTSCTLTANSARYGGSGVVNDYGTITLTNCLFAANSDNSGAGGCVNNGDAGGHIIMTSCTLASNNGGGVFNGYSGSLTMTGCLLTANRADYSYGGGGGVFNDGDLTMANCTLTTNSSIHDSYGGGGGVSNLTQGTLTMTGCTLTANSASINGGGGIFNGGRIVTLTDDIFYGDSGGEISNPGQTGVTESYCDDGDLTSGVLDINHNFSADPKFVRVPNSSLSDPGDIHLRPGSPCAGAGTANAPTYSPFDLDGIVRSTPPSVGAYEGAVARLAVSGLTISRAGGIVTVAVTLTNSGTAPASNVQVLSAKLGAVAASAPLPSVSTLAAGASTTLNLQFATTATGRTPLTLQGTSSGPTFSVGQNVKAP